MTEMQESGTLVVPEAVLAPPRDAKEFKFPFNPYPIQLDFMMSLFTALEERKLGIFESPTGTGKSLSMLCGALTWLEKRNLARWEYLENILKSIDLNSEERKAGDAVDWIQAQHELRQKRETVNAAKREMKFLETIRDKRKKHALKRPATSFKTDPQTRKLNEKQNISTKAAESVEDELDDLLLNDDFAPEGFSDSEGSDGESDEQPEFFQNRIIFASRTHSQLCQFVNELKRTEYAAKISTCSLASRQNLCVNPEVMNLKNLSLINERCLEIQKKSKDRKTSATKRRKGCGGCPFFNRAGIEALKNEILSEPMDIEELVNVGKQNTACPYYASRKASKEAQLLLLPYNTLLHGSTREGVGLQIKNAVILLDEAHNIIESISNMHSTSVNFDQLGDCTEGLKMYLNRYMSRFNPKHLLKLKQLSFIIKALTRFTGTGSDSETTRDAQNVFTIQEFKTKAGIDNLDIYELQSFIRKSKLVFKLKGFLVQCQKIEEKSAELKLSTSNNKPSSKTPLKLPPKKVDTVDKVKAASSTRLYRGQSVLAFVEFLKSLLCRDSGGRIIRENKTLKFLLLDTSFHFSDLLNSARSIILAGGTMKPYDEVEDQLFHTARNRIYHFSCDHVIPKENLVCLSLNHGPTSKLLDFTYHRRGSPETLEELSRTILNVAKIVPGGLVIFLPSYDYENLVQNYMKSSGYLEKIESRKKVFREPKDSSCDQVLAEYSRQIKNSTKGALLFAVIGGKLSEGINFSDDLGRCVMVVGLPYPNITSLEVKEKINFISQRFGTQKGSQLLANMCSKAVNQSIGRAIRHSQDYAAILLVDNRFSRQSQQELLPNWILKQFQVCDQFGEVVTNVARFFASKKKDSGTA